MGVYDDRLTVIRARIAQQRQDIASRRAALLTREEELEKLLLREQELLRLLSAITDEDTRQSQDPA